MEWVLLRFQLASFMPWSDVRRIPLVRVGGLSIHITESLSSSKGKKNSMAATGIGGNSSSSSNSSGSISSGSISSSTKGILGSRTDNDEQPPMSSSSTLSRRQSIQHVDGKDSWEHQGRRASLSRSYSADSDGSGGGGTDGYELERVAQATLEHALGHEFAAKYQVRGRRRRILVFSTVDPINACDVRELEIPVAGRGWSCKQLATRCRSVPSLARCAECLCSRTVLL